MAVFVGGKERFVPHLRPADVLHELLLADHAVDLAGVESALTQLRDRGNLSAQPDTTEVATVQDFYRVRLFYLIDASWAAPRAAD